MLKKVTNINTRKNRFRENFLENFQIDWKTSVEAL